MVDPEKVKETVRAYFAATRALDIEALLATCAEDVVMHSPVGEPPRRGREEVRKFFMTIIDFFDTVGLTEEFLFAIPGEAAAKWNCRGIAVNGRSVSFEGIDVYKINDEGKIREFWGYWDPGVLVSSLAG